MNVLSLLLIGAGVVFWVWGSWPLLQRGHLLAKLHALSVSDTLGSALILVGLLLLRNREWPLLLLALSALTVWNTIFGYVLAHTSSSRHSDD
ncbi:sodium:proton antiporter [Synechococcus sp. RSCCF101]|uniref:monovalent cation/H(+) antiporter subunit G n=1 Tax=Synechococcus sp. RSCCF101 TaxID=2511069 RepID=UPI0012486BD9|nr:monovalent cation/H(+) antiporter subunit G [Synechococcus sp. RSCCF101]QEY31198.1 sodium:proton antiporter [Synechococcus sp. RSCCF101]